jgi:hypothetical protein
VVLIVILASRGLGLAAPGLIRARVAALRLGRSSLLGCLLVRRGLARLGRMRCRCDIH